MSLNQFILTVGTELQELLWRDVPQKALAEEIDELERQIQESTAEADRYQASTHQLRKDLADKELRAAWLTERVEVYLHVKDQPNAWRHALELDQLQQTISAERLKLRRRQRAYSDQRIHIRRLAERQASLLEELVAL
ncbi:MAG TPA: hypothetical protein VK395_12905 [Gemmataceae bacterium]|nr:hypothetical protein [Gemmataceae bacterium]